ncbi:hypothetical protein EVAR_77024_1 [Eumeta japonica]|uniref:Uncharacterized protein n=1 Tax=Eumeta variegata TaxID=151549 RepID=A0A4C1SFE5_EUMVA|nr:hypothetical protein EVAR_77024_1 [Eumeta japonica]
MFENNLKLAFAHGSTRVIVERVRSPYISTDRAVRHDLGLAPGFGYNRDSAVDYDSSLDLDFGSVQYIHNVNEMAAIRDSSYHIAMLLKHSDGDGAVAKRVVFERKLTRFEPDYGRIAV